ncbi:helix-turn-helix domain-containing protein [Kribbella kalugense]|uniref:Excisionase family DNA binding protein n=1 Tax=Kribbella kalugense TaxID=2512221 RepID=A0A4R7ZYV9_9ACTN|nr:helix-turn-helix domain-containing protein [Kribbella kalugense]TDW23329.1 excisionase family DNA binding protein [Kribbella kalugense]
MAQELYSVEQVANRLGLHVRTIRNYVRDGRLKAVRIGKQYRITREDLEAFTGTPTAVIDVDRSSRHVEASSIVHIDAVDRATADRISTHILGALNQPEAVHLKAETIYDEDRAVLKVIILGNLPATAELLRLIALLADD